MKILLLFGLVALSKGDTYVPGTPGAPWSPEVAATIRLINFYLSFDIFVIFVKILNLSF